MVVVAKSALYFKECPTSMPLTSSPSSRNTPVHWLHIFKVLINNFLKSVKYCEIEFWSLFHFANPLKILFIRKKHAEKLVHTFITSKLDFVDLYFSGFLGAAIISLLTITWFITFTLASSDSQGWFLSLISFIYIFLLSVVKQFVCRLYQIVIVCKVHSALFRTHKHPYHG